MMPMTSRTLLSLLSFSILSWSGSLLAAPRGAVLSPDELSAPHRAGLRRQIQRARRHRPGTFKALSALRVRLPQIAARQRGRLVTVVMPLRALGRDGLMPMLAALAVEAEPRGSLSKRAWRGWQVSLLEAVGSLRDARARPVLEAVLFAKDRDPMVRRGAAVALARLGDDRAMTTLIRLIRKGSDSTRLAVLPALGQCRRTRAARELASILGSAGDDHELASTAAAALGQVGNAWAWKTPAVAQTGEGDATRRAAVEALVSSYPQLARGVRDEAVKALMLVGHPETRGVIAAARDRASGAQKGALDRLDRRIVELGLLR
jgi:HEAT repeat protein